MEQVVKRAERVSGERGPAIERVGELSERGRVEKEEKVEKVEEVERSR